MGYYRPGLGCEGLGARLRWYHPDICMTREDGRRSWPPLVELLLQGTQSVVPPTIHPDTGRPYASAWLKCWHPEVFCAALLNSQPMGFYAPAQIVRDARDHGVEVRPVRINASRWDCTLEPTGEDEQFAVRLGLCMVKLT